MTEERSAHDFWIAQADHANKEEEEDHSWDLAAVIVEARCVC